MPANDKCVKLPVFTGWLQVNRGNPAICDVFKVSTYNGIALIFAYDSDIYLLVISL